VPQQPPLPLPLYLPPAPASALPPLPPWLLGGRAAVCVPVAVPLPLAPEPPAATSAKAVELAELRAERDAAVAEVAALRELCAAQRERLHALRG
jgi:hypothetical protein